MKTAIFPGTFDPPTLGHLDIIERAANICDKLYIAISENNVKHVPLLSSEEKKYLLNQATRHIKNIEVVTFSGLIAEYAKALDVHFIVRGLRNCTDFEYESQMSSANNALTGVDTLFLVSSPAYSHLSATLIREIGRNGHRLHGFVPESIEETIFKSLSTKSP